MTRERHRAVVVLGSNVDAEANVDAALARLRGLGDVLATAPPRSTAPVGPPGQPRFLNAAVLLATALGREALRAALRDIEAAMGRVRSADRYAPRPIDLDVVAWEGAVVDPDVATRSYLRELLREVAPDVPLASGG